MVFVIGLVTVLLISAAYSAGVTLASRPAVVSPRIVDLGLIVAVCVAALLTRPLFVGRAGLVIWLLVAGALGWVLARSRQRTETHGPLPAPAVSDRGTTWLRRQWAKWKTFAAAMGNYQSRVILSFFYFTLMLPFGLIARVFMDPLRLRERGGSAWVGRSPNKHDLEDLLRQF